MFATHFCMHTSFTALNDILLRSFMIVNDLYILVYDTEKYDRNMEPCNTVKYGRIRSVCWTFTSVYCRVRISEPSTWVTPNYDDLNSVVTERKGNEGADLSLFFFRRVTIIRVRMEPYLASIRHVNGCNTVNRKTAKGDQSMSTIVLFDRWRLWGFNVGYCTVYQTWYLL